MVNMTDCILKEKAVAESSVAKSFLSLDTEIECSILAFGITDKTDCTEMMLEKEGGFRRLEGVQSKFNLQAKEVGQQPQPRHQHQLFDFVHIRFQNSGLLDGPKVFRLAFEQTKPGGWIEVVEATHAVSTMKGREFNSTANQRATHGSRSVAPEGHASNSASWVVKELLAAGFVDVEEKTARKPGSFTMGTPLQKLWDLGKLMKALCTGLWRWNCGDSGNIQTIQEKSQDFSSPSLFVIARKPPLKD